MIAIIIAIDQLIWRPVIAWAEKFKFEQVESTDVPHSPVLDFLRSSKVLTWLSRFTTRPARERVTLYFAKKRSAEIGVAEPSKARSWIGYLLSVAAIAGLLYAFVKIVALLSHLTRDEVSSIAWGAGATFLRVVFTLFLAGLWTVPIGVLIGLKPKIAAVAQPIVQILASVPATALFPVILLLLIRVGGGLGIGSIVLLLLGTQWYLLFNIIAGAMSIPTDLKEVTSVFRFGRMERWRELFLPGIFPFLITGFITASGGAWNASIVAEYFRFRGHTYSVTGLGAVISNATDTGNFALLLGATIVMAAMVVTINRLVWRRLYAVAATRYKLET
jgi:NitT/TauT family transport system permease protein